jgi:exosortase
MAESRSLPLSWSNEKVWLDRLPQLVGVAVFLTLFWDPLTNTVRTWATNADAGHGLLLAPVALYLAWRRGLATGARAQTGLGLGLLAAAVLLRYASGLAAEVFTMRLSVLMAGVALVVFAWGVRQVLHWWLPALLLLLSIPLPELVLGALALPLQFEASRLGASLLEWRHVPVALSGNVIQLPGGHKLFVTEACSGLRSLSALLALGVLIGGVFLDRGWARALLALVAVPIAIVLNAVRIFVTGFSVHYIDPALGEGLMHYTEGWVMFLAAFASLAVVAWGLSAAERHFAGMRTREAVAA